MSAPRSLLLLALGLAVLHCGRSSVTDDAIETPEFEAGSEPGDAGIVSCESVEDCAPFGFGSPCETLEGCGCGTFYSCHQSRCVSYSVECRDSGVGPMPDAGPPICRAASDCEDTNGVASGCTDFQVRSCIEGQCITECQGRARTCYLGPGGPENAGCLVCEDGRPSCVNQCAAANVRALYEVEQTDCEVWPSSGLPVQASQLVSTDDRGPTCSYQMVHRDSGETLGPYHLLESFEYLAHFPELGGTCTGAMLPTGLERIFFGCPNCFIRLVRLQ